MTKPFEYLSGVDHLVVHQPTAADREYMTAHGDGWHDELGQWVIDLPVGRGRLRKIRAWMARADAGSDVRLPDGTYL